MKKKGILIVAPYRLLGFFMPESFFYNFFMALPLKEESYVSYKRMLSGQNMESLQKLTLSGTHFHKIKRP